MTFFIVGAGGFGREALDALRGASPSAAELRRLSFWRRLSRSCRGQAAA